MTEPNRNPVPAGATAEEYLRLAETWENRRWVPLTDTELSEQSRAITRLNSRCFALALPEKAIVASEFRHETIEYLALERLLNREDADFYLALTVVKLLRSGTDTVLRWLELAERYYQRLIDSGYAGEDGPRHAIPGILAAVLRFRRINDQPPTTPEQEYAYALLNLAAIDSALEGRRVVSGGEYGEMRSLENPELEAFALTGPDPERLERACAAIRAGAKRFGQVLAVADGIDLPLSDGAL